MLLCGSASWFVGPSSRSPSPGRRERGGEGGGGRGRGQQTVPKRGTSMTGTALYGTTHSSATLRC